MKASALLLAAAAALFAVPALAQPIVNGTRAGDAYGTAAAYQLTETGFGDNMSELNAAYCDIVNDRLYLLLTGNIEGNFNKIEIFIDSKPGGENVLSGLPGNDGAFRMAGMGFDAGFEADYHLIARRGNSFGDRFDLDFAQLGTPNFSFYGDLFGGGQVGVGATGTGLNTLPIQVAYDNSNVGGVVGGSGPANALAALAVQTGLELSISLADLGYTAGEVRVCAFVNNQNHDYASNQFLGPLAPPAGNMGGDGTGTFTGVINFNLANFPGNQYFSCGDRAVPATQATWGRVKSSYR